MRWALSTSTGPGGGTASHVTVTLLGSSQGYPRIPCPFLLQQKGTIFTRADHGGHKGLLGTVPLHGLFHLAQGQHKLKSPEGKHQEREVVTSTLQSNWDDNGTMPSMLGRVLKGKQPGLAGQGQGGTREQSWVVQATLGHPVPILTWEQI